MLLYLFGTVILLICIYMVRHYCFTINRLINEQRQPYVDIDTADWPAGTALVAAHNEEAVVADILGALREIEYPKEMRTIGAVDERLVDPKREIDDRFVERWSARIE